MSKKNNLDPKVISDVLSLEQLREAFKAQKFEKKENVDEQESE